MRRNLVLGLILGLGLGSVGCAEETKGPGGGNNNGGTAGTTAGAAGSSSTGESGISGGQMVDGTSGTTGNVAGDGAAGACEVGVQCANGGLDNDTCGSLTLEGDVKQIMMPGNVLMVFDRSGSMTTAWNGMPRWQAAGTAMVSALTPVQDQLTIGALFFPSDQALLSCVVEPINTAATQIDFMKGPDALAKMMTGGANATPMYQPGLGSTPTSEAITAADAALTAAAATLTGTTVVILVTDGAPTCMWNQQASIATVSAWAAKGIKTFVLGVPGVDPAGEANLNAVAVAGGTMQYISTTDAMTLQTKIHDIVLQTVSVGFDSCTINLDPPADPADKLQLVVTDMGIDQSVPHDFATGEAAWTVTPDGKTVELLNSVCDAAKGGTYEKIVFTFGCKDLPIAMPPEPE